MDLQGRNEFVMLVGVTGSGKSTLVKYLTMDPTLRTVIGKGRQCIYADNESTIGTQTHTSKTSVPSKVLDVTSGQLLIDCPGFEDTRKNPANDIAGAFLLKQALASATQIKIVLVENFFSLKFHNSRTEFLKTLSHVARLLPDASKFIGSMCIVVTKVDSTDSDEDVALHVKDFLNDTIVGHYLKEKDKLIDTDINLAETRQQLDSEIRLAGALLHEKTGVGVFRTPCKSDAGKKCSLCIKPLKVRNIIFERTIFVESDPSNYHISVSDTTKLFIKEKILVNSKNEISKQFDFMIVFVIKNIINGFRNASSILPQEKLLSLQADSDAVELLLELMMYRNGLSELQSSTNWKWAYALKTKLIDISFETLKLNFYHDCIQESPALFFISEKRKHLKKFYNHIGKFRAEIDMIAQMSSFLSMSKSHQTVQAMRKYRLGINETNFALFINELDSWGLKFAEFPNIIKQKPSKHLLQSINSILENGYRGEVSKLVQGNDLVFEGPHIFLKEIAEHIKKTTQTIYILASRTVFIDCDLRMQNTHLVIVAPLIEIVGTNSFYLTGSDAPKHQKVIADQGTLMKPGAVGLDGAAGFSSGSVHFITNSVTNNRLLTLRMFGGAGADGQQGGDGFKGIDSKMALMQFDVINCLFQNNGKTCKKYEPEYTIQVTHYVRNEACVATVTTSNGSPPSEGGAGGNGGTSGSPGAVLSTFEGGDLIVFGVDGCAGQAALGGAGGSSCTTLTTSVKCDLYGASKCVDKCHEQWHSCKHTTAFAGKPGNPSAAPAQILYKFQEPSGANLGQILTAFLQKQFKSLANSEQNIFDITSLFNLHLLANKYHKESILTPFFFMVSSLVSAKVTPAIERIILEEIHSKLNQHRADFLKGSENMRDVILLDAMILSRIELIGAANSKRVIIKLGKKLKSFKDESMSLLSDWHSVYKISVINENKADINQKIEATKILRKKVLHENLKHIEKGLERQFEALVNKTNDLKLQTEKSKHELQVQKQKIAQNMIKRAVFGSLKVLCGVASVIQPAVGASLTLAVSVGESIAIKEQKSVINNNIKIPGAVSQVSKLISQFEKRREENAGNRTELQKSIAKDVLNLDIKIGDLLRDSTRRDLQQALATAERAANINTAEVANKNFKLVFDACRADLEASGKTDTKVVNSIKALKVAQHASVLSTTVISSLQQVQRDQSVMDEINYAIEANLRTMLQLEAYETSLYATFQPQLTNMLNTFTQFTNNTQGQEQQTLIFGNFDMQKMIRQFVSFLRKFTDGFPDEQEDLMGLVADLEELASSSMLAQTHINELIYKLQLTHLIGQITDGSGCYGSEICAMRIKVSTTLRTSELLQRYAKLESAYQQAIFPFAGRGRVASLQPGADDNATIAVLTERVDAMVKELAERDETIKVESDKDVRNAEFNSKYSASAPFYKWRQDMHADQIGRVLRGERVTLVADVQRTARNINAVKFEQIGINVTAPGVDLQPFLKFLMLELTHGGDNHFRCGDRYYAIAADAPLVFEQSFERDQSGKPVVQNAVVDKFSHTDVPFSPFTVWTMQLKAGPDSKAKDMMKKLAQYANLAELELFGRGTYVVEHAAVCQKDLSQQFDLFL